MFVVVDIFVIKLLRTKNHGNCGFVFLGFEHFVHGLAIAPDVRFNVFFKIEFIKLKLIQLIQNANLEIIDESTILSIWHVALIHFVDGSWSQKVDHWMHHL